MSCSTRMGLKSATYAQNQAVWHSHVGRDEVLFAAPLPREPGGLRTPPQVKGKPRNATRSDVLVNELFANTYAKICLGAVLFFSFPGPGFLRPFFGP